MAGFADSYMGKLRALVGHRLILTPGSRTLIEDKTGKYLLQKQSATSKWCLPGGGSEPGESLEETAIRETLEETGLTTRDLKPYAMSNDPEIETFSYPNGDQCQFFIMVFHTKNFEGKLHVDQDETLELGWFGTSNLPPLMPSMRRSIEAYGRFKATGEFQLI